MSWIWLLSCAFTATEPCPDGPGTAVVAEGTLGQADHCGTFALDLDEHAYVSVPITEPDLSCEGSPSGAVEMPYEPIYSNLSDSGPKWTFDVQGMAAGSGSLEVDCEEGTTWVGFFTVGEEAAR